MFNLPTREQAQEIVKNSEVFYCIETEVEGYTVEMYNYRLASYNDFVKNDAFELRGLTFVQHPAGTWERFILMNKFFNVNQCQNWLESDLKDKKIVRVQDKLDGSIISFVKLPNGSIRAKSKMSFDSEQAQMAQEIYNKDSDLQEFVKDCFEDGITPIFELVSPFNQIVLEYSETKLVLLQMRDSKGGYCLNIEQYRDLYNIEVADKLCFDSLEILMNVLKIETEIEGVIVTFSDGQMAKVKTDWYMQRHGLITDLKENNIIELILNEEIDDIISCLSEDSEKRKFIEEIQEKVDKEFNHLVLEYKELRRKYFQDYSENRKKFALKFKYERLFGFVMRKLNTSFKEVEQVAEQSVKDYLLRETNSLIKAKEWLRK